MQTFPKNTRGTGSDVTPGHWVLAVFIGDKDIVGIQYLYFLIGGSRLKY